MPIQDAWIDVTMSPPRPLYYVNWWCDGLVMGGLSIIAWLGLKALCGSAEPSGMTPLVLALGLVVNFPHFSATIYRLYQKPENLRQFPVTAWVVPWVLAAAVIACVWQPQVVAPYFLMLYLLWSPYHYSGQTLGVTMIYARRAGFPIGRRERLALSAFVYAAFVWAVSGMSSSGSADIYGMAAPNFPAPAWLHAAAAAVMCTGALGFGGFVLAWCARERRLLPPIVLVPVAAHFAWFVAGGGVTAFIAIVPFFHGLQYLLVALAIQLKQRIDGGGERSWRRVGREALRWWGFNIMGGAILFVAPVIVFSAAPVPGLSMAAILVAAVNIHHFFVDGVIWKLRDPATSVALRMNFGEFGGPWRRADMQAKSICQRSAATIRITGASAAGDGTGPLPTGRGEPASWLSDPRSSVATHAAK